MDAVLDIILQLGKIGYETTLAYEPGYKKGDWLVYLSTGDPKYNCKSTRTKSPYHTLRKAYDYLNRS